MVVTRPRAQATGLATAIEREGGTALVYPAVEICDIDDLRPLHAIIDRLNAFDLAVFVSPNAVRMALKLVLARRATGWPRHLRVAAIGPGSRRELEQQGVSGVIAPHGRADSESLLAVLEGEAQSIARLVIFRGEGGREMLAEALLARGMQVEYAECYRRVRPQLDAAPLLAAWARGEVHAVSVSSAEGLGNFFALIGSAGQAWLRRTPLFVPHARVAGEAAQLGAGTVRVSGPGDAEVLAALVAYFRDAQ
ncbi:MAG: uroporphyrinogen-III synthase [Betaproteobacteria bacterium]|nr:uroporphyrinogen-III synthase [Betaproteobacteria bacterium]